MYCTVFQWGYTQERKDAPAIMSHLFTPHSVSILAKKPSWNYTMRIGFHCIGLGSWSDHDLRHHSQAGRGSVHISLTQCWDAVLG